MQRVLGSATSGTGQISGTFGSEHTILLHHRLHLPIMTSDLHWQSSRITAACKFRSELWLHWKRNLQITPTSILPRFPPQYIENGCIFGSEYAIPSHDLLYIPIDSIGAAVILKVGHFPGTRYGGRFFPHMPSPPTCYTHPHYPAYPWPYPP